MNKELDEHVHVMNNFAKHHGRLHKEVHKGLAQVRDDAAEMRSDVRSTNHRLDDMGDKCAPRPHTPCIRHAYASTG